MASTVPHEIAFEGTTIQISTFHQLEQMSRKNLMGRVTVLRQQVGTDRLPPLTGHGPDLTIDWILNVQQGLVRAATGRSYSLKEFGAPAPANEDGYFGRSAEERAAPPSKQHQAAPQQWHQPQQQENNMQANQNAYAEACSGAEAARRRNAGSNIFG